MIREGKTNSENSKQNKSLHLSSVFQTLRRASLQSTFFDTKASITASVLGCNLKRHRYNSKRKVFPLNNWLTALWVSTYFAQVFSMMDGFERRWLQFFFSLGQTCKTEILSGQLKYWYYFSISVNIRAGLTSSFF